MNTQKNTDSTKAQGQSADNHVPLGYDLIAYAWEVGILSDSQAKWLADYFYPIAIPVPPDAHYYDYLAEIWMNAPESHVHAYEQYIFENSP